VRPESLIKKWTVPFEGLTVPVHYALFAFIGPFHFLSAPSPTPHPFPYRGPRKSEGEGVSVKAVPEGVAVVAPLIF